MNTKRLFTLTIIIAQILTISLTTIFTTTNSVSALASDCFVQLTSSLRYTYIDGDTVNINSNNNLVLDSITSSVRASMSIFTQRCSGGIIESAMWWDYLDGYDNAWVRVTEIPFSTSGATTNTTYNISAGALTTALSKITRWSAGYAAAYCDPDSCRKTADEWKNFWYMHQNSNTVSSDGKLSASFTVPWYTELLGPETSPGSNRYYAPSYSILVGTDPAVRSNHDSSSIPAGSIEATVSPSNVAWGPTHPADSSDHGWRVTFNITNFQIPNLTPGNTYYWRLKQVGNNTIGYIPGDSFTISAPFSASLSPEQTIKTVAAGSSVTNIITATNAVPGSTPKLLTFSAADALGRNNSSQLSFSFSPTTCTPATSSPYTCQTTLTSTASSSAVGTSVVVYASDGTSTYSTSFQLDVVQPGPTTITLSLDKSNPRVGDRIIFSGNLKDSQNHPVSGKIIRLVSTAPGSPVIKSSDNITDGITHNTNSNGDYVIGLTITTQDTFSAYTKFDGDAFLNASQTPAVTVTPTPPCSGNILLNFDPSIVAPSGSTTPRASNLSNCAGLIIHFRQNDCSGTEKSSCTSGDTGCSGTAFSAISGVGSTNYAACIDKSIPANSNFTDAGESDIKPLITSADANAIGSCGTGMNRATGLITTPQFTAGSKFGTSSGACIIDPKSAFVPFNIPKFDDLKSLYYNQR